MSGFPAIARKERGAESKESVCGVQLGESTKLQLLELVLLSAALVCVAAERLLLLHRVIDRWLNCLGRVEFYLHHWDCAELKTDCAELKTDWAVRLLIRRVNAEMVVARMDMVLFILSRFYRLHWNSVLTATSAQNKCLLHNLTWCLFMFSVKLHPNAPQLLVSCVRPHFLMPLMQGAVWKTRENSNENLKCVLNTALEGCACMLSGLKSCSMLLTHLRSTGQRQRLLYELCEM